MRTGRQRQQALLGVHIDAKDYTFRLGPLPPGLYTLAGYLNSGKLKISNDTNDASVRHWRGETNHVRVDAGMEIRDVVINLTESSAR